ncbi:MAG TPA: nucleoside hydrolase [Acidimicrobiia bacterium]|nr:nucleoside hydrolase [Acidimicrobiia bacterium]
MRLWIDTDVGDNPDDAVALVCAAAHPAVELVGVSTTGGRTEWRAALARRLVDAEVVPGEQPDALAATFAAARPEALLAIGPLTNLAALVVLEVTLPPLTVMGGVLEAVRHRGRLRHVEWNFGSDPAASSLVVANADLTLVPLEVTVAMRLEPEVLAKLVACERRLEPEVARWSAEHDDPVVLHDPLALLVAAGEPFVTTESQRLVVDAHDGSVRVSDQGREQTVVVGVDAPAAVDRVLGLLG